MCTILNQLFISNTRAQQDSLRTSRTSRIHIYLFSFLSTHLHNTVSNHSATSSLSFIMSSTRVSSAEYVWIISLCGPLFASISYYEVVLHHSLPITICLCNKTFRSFSHRVSRFRLQKSSPHSDRYSRIWSLQYHEHNGFLGIASSRQRSQLTHHSQSLPSGSLPLLASVLHAKVSRSEHAVCVGYTRIVFFCFVSATS